MQRFAAAEGDGVHGAVQRLLHLVSVGAWGTARASQCLRRLQHAGPKAGAAARPVGWAHTAQPVPRSKGGATSPETPTFPPEASGGVYVFSHDSSRTPTRKHAVSSARHSCATPDSIAAAYEVCAVTCPRQGRASNDLPGV